MSYTRIDPFNLLINVFILKNEICHIWQNWHRQEQERNIEMLQTKRGNLLMVKVIKGGLSVVAESETLKIPLFNAKKVIVCKIDGRIKKACSRQVIHIK